MCRRLNVDPGCLKTGMPEEGRQTNQVARMVFEVERPAQGCQAILGKQVVEGESIGLLGRIGKIGVDLDGLHIGNNQEWGIEQGLAILQQLLIGFAKIGMFAFILNREVATPPDIGPARATALLGSASLKGKALAGGVLFKGVAWPSMRQRSMKCS